MPTTSKAGAFANECEAAGWTVGPKGRIRGEEGRKTVVATRGIERVQCTWTNNIVVGYIGEYAISMPDGTTKGRYLQTLTSARRVIRAAPITEAAIENGIKSTNVGRLSFDPDEFEDADLLKLCQGKTLVWRNRISGQLENAHFPRTEFEERERLINGKKEKYSVQITNRHVSVTESSDGARILNFCAADGGFRALDLGSLVSD